VGPSPALIAFLISWIAAAVIGSAIFLASLPPKARGEFPAYIRASIRAGAPGPLHPETGAGDRDDRAPLYGGRSAWFLVRQCLIRIVAVWLIGGLGTAITMRRWRHRTSEPRLKRGAVLRDARIDRKGRKRSGIALSLLLGLLLTLAIEAQLFGWIWMRIFPEYVVATILTESSTVADLVSPDGDGQWAWFEIGKGGFYRPEAVEAAFREHFYVSSWTILFLTVGVASLLGLALHRLARIAFGARRQNEDRSKYSIAGRAIDESKTCYHVLISGSPGSGKSTAIKDLLDQVRAKGRRAIVYDVGGEYVEHFFREGHDKLLNPFDARTEHWTPWTEVRSRTDCAMIAASLFPPGGKDPFWADAAQQFFRSLLDALAGSKYATNAGLDHLLRAGKVDTLYKLLGDTEAARFLDPKGDTLASNVLATVMSKLGVWSVLDDPKDARDAFSIRAFIESDDDRWLFLSTREDSALLMKPLLSLWCDVAAKAILSLPETSTNKHFCVLDEIASLQRLPALPGLLERGRKHGVSVVLGLQAMSQLKDAYGVDAAQALVAQPQTWLILRSVDPDTSRWLEQALGSAETLETATSKNVGRDAIAQGYAFHERKDISPIVLASEIATLPDFEGFLRLPGTPEVFRVRYAPRRRARIAEPFIPKTSPGRK
jgi:hypothetical protein